MANVQRLYRTHFPSKLAEYLALGLPLLLFGPAHATGIRWGLMHPGAALTITRDDSATWAAAMVRLRDDPGLRCALAEEGLRAGDKDFAPQGICRQFLAHLQGAFEENENS
jgi:hypothetical protein